MLDPLSRRDWMKLVGAAGAGAMVPAPPASFFPLAAPILPLSSTSEVFVPPRGRAFQKFSFDFPEPSVEFAGLRFGFLVFSRENAYGMDRDAMRVEGDGDARVVTCSGFVWAGGQERAAGRLVARLKRNGTFVEWD